MNKKEFEQRQQRLEEQCDHWAKLASELRRDVRIMEEAYKQLAAKYRRLDAQVKRHIARLNKFDNHPH